MKLLKVKIEGAGSIIQPLSYKLERPGLSLLLGPNGVGKTSILNSISWCLYGEVLKKDSSIEPWPHIIGKDFLGTKVKITCDEGIEIIRCLKYKGKIKGKKGGNRLIILQDGKEIMQTRNKKDVQAWINQKIGYSFPLFKNSVLFGQETKRLLDEDGPSKKKIFDEAFESTFINRAQEIAKKNFDKTNQEDTSKRLELANLLDKLEIQKTRKDEIRKAFKAFKKKQKSVIEDLGLQIKTFRGIIAGIHKRLEVLSTPAQLWENIRVYESKIDSYREKISEGLQDQEFRLTLDINRYESELEELEKGLSKAKKNAVKARNCSECGQPLVGKDLISAREKAKESFKKTKAKIKNLQTVLAGCREQYSKVSTELGKQSKYREYLEQTKDHVKGLNAKLSQIEDLNEEAQAKHREIASIKDRIKAQKEDKFTLSQKEVNQAIAELEIQIANKEVEIKSIGKRLEIDRWLIKDPLSNSGLKAFIFDSMLNKVNFHLKKYSKRIGFLVNVFMNLESANKDFCISVIKGSKEVPYQDLSRGQKQLAQVALCFALNDTQVESKPINILLMDEIFESLDPENIEIVAGIISEKAKTRSIHLITHQKTFSPLNCYKVYIRLNEQEQTVVDQKFRAA